MSNNTHRFHHCVLTLYLYASKRPDNPCPVLPWVLNATNITGSRKRWKRQSPRECILLHVIWPYLLDWQSKAMTTLRCANPKAVSECDLPQLPPQTTTNQAQKLRFQGKRSQLEGTVPFIYPGPHILWVSGLVPFDPLTLELPDVATCCGLAGLDKVHAVSRTCRICFCLLCTCLCGCLSW